MDIEEILKNIWLALGLRNKTALAQSLGKRIDYFNYPVKHKKVTRELESLLIRIHNINPEYLKTGKGEILSEKKTPTSGCSECAKKDIEVMQLLQELRVLNNELNNCRRELGKLRETSA